MMKKLILIVIVLGALQICAQETLSPYFTVAELETSISEASQQVKDAVVANGYEIIGEYNPAHNENLFVICFTNEELRGLSLQRS